MKTNKFENRKQLIMLIVELYAAILILAACVFNGCAAQPRVETSLEKAVKILQIENQAKRLTE